MMQTWFVRFLSTCLSSVSVTRQCLPVQSSPPEGLPATVSEGSVGAFKGVLMQLGTFYFSFNKVSLWLRIVPDEQVKRGQREYRHLYVYTRVEIQKIIPQGITFAVREPWI